MRSTSFGSMRKIHLPGPLDGTVEVMQFERKGRSHVHADRTEVAVCVSGHGEVVVGDEWVAV